MHNKWLCCALSTIIGLFISNIYHMWNILIQCKLYTKSLLMRIMTLEKILLKRSPTIQNEVPVCVIYLIIIFNIIIFAGNKLMSYSPSNLLYPKKLKTTFFKFPLVDFVVYRWINMKLIGAQSIDCIEVKFLMFLKPFYDDTTKWVTWFWLLIFLRLAYSFMRFLEVESGNILFEFTLVCIVSTSQSFKFFDHILMINMTKLQINTWH